MAVYAIGRVVRRVEEKGAVMPFKSQAQQRYLWAKKPNVAKQFAKHTPAKGQSLPKAVRVGLERASKAGTT